MLLDILGPEAVLDHFSHEAPLDGAVESAFRYGIVGTIYGGSSEIMRESVNSSKPAVMVLIVAEGKKPVGIVHVHDVLRAGVA